MSSLADATRGSALSPGWDRQNPLTLRFADPALERSYRSAGGEPGRIRLRIANLVGAGIWVLIGIVGPVLLGLPAEHFYLAAAVNAGWDGFVTILTLRDISLAHVGAFAFASSTISAFAIVVVFGVDQRFVTLGVAALMASAAFGIALVRPEWLVAAGVSVMTMVVFASVVLALGISGTAVFEALLLSTMLTGATIGSRYLEAAERTAFRSGQLVADLHARVDRLFRQYLSPDVAQALVDDPTRADLGGEVAEVSVLFADLQGFTQFSERTPAPDVVAMLNAAFGAAVPAVFAEGGTVVQFMGDALMAVFNAPIRQADHALRACRAGLALQRVTSHTGGDAAAPRFRVGINSGPALVGNVGSADLHNFLAIGDTTNVAARLQSFAPAGSVVLGQQTYEIVRDQVKVRPLGSPDFKGKSVPTDVYELLGMRGEEG
ncbi:MAG: adenylate/guanylate cyclase domain-containing protein [Chloroflexota bacterium]